MNDAIDVLAMYLEYTGRGCCIDVILQEFICKGVEDILSSFAFPEINRNQDARDVCSSRPSCLSPSTCLSRSPAVL